MRGKVWAAVIVGSVAAAVPAPGHLLAQDVTVSAGAATYDLAGVGTTWTAHASYRHVVTGPLRVELGAGFLRYGSPETVQETLLTPELGVTLVFPAGPVRVMASAGGGAALVLNGIGRDEPTLYSGIALDVPAGGRLSIRPGLRLRWIDPWAGTVADFTLGLGVRLGG